jgi:NAD(P)-dependent dehydrogenase (short-subunit alcohol dehydrogenase family)
MDSVFGLEGRKILVLGGGQGMGEATVKRIAEQGAHIAVADLVPERAETVAMAVRDAGGTATSIGVDVLDDNALVAAIRKVETDFGPLDGMATVIGMAGWASLLELERETWDADLNRNVRYFFVAAREVARSLLERGAPGSIVCVASVDGLRSAPNHAAYGVAKAGLIHLVKSMAVEWSGQGIRINCVAPGGIVTPRLPDRGAEAERKNMAQIPMQRRGTVDEIAKAITFFLSDMSSYVTGQTLAVDGGFMAASLFNVQLPPKNTVMGAERA